MAVFQAVADAGSFRGGAKRLGLSPSVVSHHVTQLEMQLGVALLYRSTRRLSLTDAGTDLLASARRMTQAADDGLASIQRRRDQPAGRLRVTVPSGGQHPSFGLRLPEFIRRYPGIILSVNFTDTFADLGGSDFDLAIRGPCKLGLDRISARPAAERLSPGAASRQSSCGTPDVNHPRLDHGGGSTGPRGVRGSGDPT
jgi:DNA-binding transcriptional LysR family regulator